MLRRLWIWFLQCLGFDPRGIFRYYDGRRYRNGDPMVMARAIWSAVTVREPMPGVAGVPEPFDSDASRKLIASGEGMKIQQGYAEVAAAVRSAWSISDVDGGGLTEEECDRLLRRFELYLGDLKKNGNPKPIPSESTVTSQDEESITSNERPTGFSSTGNSLELPDVSDLLTG